MLILYSQLLIIIILISCFGGVRIELILNISCPPLPDIIGQVDHGIRITANFSRIIKIKLIERTMDWMMGIIGKPVNYCHRTEHHTNSCIRDNIGKGGAATGSTTDTPSTSALSAIIKSWCAAVWRFFA